MATDNFHAGSGPSQDYLYDVEVPTPTHAERARTMASRITSGTLSTLAHADTGYAGHPYGSLVTTALHDGHPVFLISGLAEHTRNLQADARASLLLTEQGEDSPLALGRVTLVGECAEIPADGLEAARDCYLTAHPDARYYLDYGDFAFWRLNVGALRYIGGFGRMSWVAVGDWLAAEPDPLADAADGIIAHMNADHADAMAEMCRAFTRAQDFEAVEMTSVDRYGFEMSVQTPQGWRPVRLAFERPVTTPGEVREAMVALVGRARS